MTPTRCAFGYEDATEVLLITAVIMIGGLLMLAGAWRVSERSMHPDVIETPAAIEAPWVTVLESHRLERDFWRAR